MAQHSNRNNTFWRSLLQAIPVNAWIALIVTLVVVLTLFWLIYPSANNVAKVGQTATVSLTPTQIKQIESIGQWEFLAVSDEEIVDTVKHGFFSDSELIRIYYGTLRLGIDLSKAHKGWIRLDGDTLCAELPQVCLLDNDFIDEARTRTFYETGAWTPADRKQLYQKACILMRKRVMTKENMNRATRLAEEQFTKLLHAMGFEYVRVITVK